MDIKQFGKGGIVKSLERKDYRLELLATAPQLPSNFEVIYGGKIKNQNGSGSCVSQATSYYAQILNFKETGKWLEFSPRDLYSQCFQEPMGSYVKDNMDRMQNSGIVLEADALSYEQGDPPSESFMRKRDDITFEEAETGKNYMIMKYLTWDNTSIDLFKQAIYHGSGAVVCAWGNNEIWKNAKIELPAYKEQLNWRHGILLLGWDDNTRLFKFINSWGTEWGQQGYGYLPYEYIEKGYVSNPMTMIDIPNDTYIKLTSQIKNLLEMIIKALQDKINKLLNN